MAVDQDLRHLRQLDSALAGLELALARIFQRLRTAAVPGIGKQGVEVMASSQETLKVTFSRGKKPRLDFLGESFEMAVGQGVDLFLKKRYPPYSVD